MYGFRDTPAKPPMTLDHYKLPHAMIQNQQFEYVLARKALEFNVAKDEVVIKEFMLVTPDGRRLLLETRGRTTEGPATLYSAQLTDFPYPVRDMGKENANSRRFSILDWNV